MRAHVAAGARTCALDVAALARRGDGGHIGDDNHAAGKHEFVACPRLLHRVVAENHLYRARQATRRHLDSTADLNATKVVEFCWIYLGHFRFVCFH